MCIDTYTFIILCMMELLQSIPMFTCIHYLICAITKRYKTDVCQTRSICMWNMHGVQKQCDSSRELLISGFSSLQSGRAHSGQGELPSINVLQCFLCLVKWTLCLPCLLLFALSSQPPSALLPSSLSPAPRHWESSLPPPQQVEG